MRPQGCIVLVIIALLIISLLSWITGISPWFFVSLLVLFVILSVVKEAYEAPQRQEIILSILVQEGRELYGLQIVELSEGRIHRGDVYSDLRDLEEAGCVTSRREREPEHERDYPRRLYKATGRQRRRRKLSFHLPAWSRPLTSLHALNALGVFDSGRIYTNLIVFIRLCRT